MANFCYRVSTIPYSHWSCTLVNVIVFYRALASFGKHLHICPAGAIHSSSARPLTGNTCRAWLVSPATPERIEIRSNSLTRDTGQQPTGPVEKEHFGEFGFGLIFFGGLGLWRRSISNAA